MNNKLSYDERIAKMLAERPFPPGYFDIPKLPTESWMRRPMKQQVPWLEVMVIAIFIIVACVMGYVSLSFYTQEAHAQTRGVELPVTVTAYTSSVDETDSTPTITASGTTTHPGTLACPKAYRFGTRVLIEGVTYTCEDLMNGKYADRFDVWMPSKAEAYSFGIKKTSVIILL